MTMSPLDSAILGPLTTTAAMAEVFSDRSRVAAMLAAEAALARALARFGLAPAALAGAVEKISADDFDYAALGRQTALSAVAVIPFVKAVQAKLPKDLERAFHRGSTTQDIGDTGFVLQMRDAIALLAADTVGVIDGLAALAERHRMTPCIGRTYLQHAAPVSFGFKVAGWLAGIADAGARLADVRGRCLMASLGGPVGTLADYREHGPAVAAAYAEELGLVAAPIAWHTRRVAIAEIGGVLAMLIGALGKMGADVAHLASTEVGEVAEPFVAGRGGSSAMPHKRNPVSATVIVAAARAAPGLAATLFSAMVASHERPPGEWHAEWHTLPLLFGLAAGALREARSLAEGLEVDAARMARNIDITRGLVFSDAAAAALAPRLGRAEAHALIGQAARAVRDTDLPLLQLIPGQAGYPSDADPAILAAAFDLGPAVAAAAGWVTPAIAAARRVRDSLVLGT